MSGRVLLYGATGRSGRALAAALVDLGERLVVGGRSPEALVPLAATLGLEPRALRAADDMADGMRDIGLLLNAAGPFAGTADAVIGACLKAKVDYMDIAGEWPVLANAEAQDREAADRGVMLLPGVGFAVAVTDCALALAAARLPGAVRLRLGLSRPHGLSRGSRATMTAMNDAAVRVRRDGVLRRLPAGSLARTFDFGRGLERAVAVSWPDIVTVYRSTGVETVECYSAMGMTGELMLRAGALAAPLMREWDARRPAAAAHARPPEPEPAVHDLHVVAEAEDRWRRVERVGFRTRDGYAATTLTAAAAVRAWLSGARRAGFQTPSGLLGADFAQRCGAAELS